MDIMEPVLPGVRKVSYEEFLARCDERNAAEWVDGEVVYMTVSVEHNDLNLWLSRIIGSFLEHSAAGKLFSEPFQMKTGPDLPGRSPDLFVLLNENLGRVRDNYIAGPADLVIEIISPESIGRDRGDKFQEYEQGGVREYWILDPIRKQAELYLRGEDGYYHAAPVGPDGVYRSAVLEGMWLRVAWFWSSPLPSQLAVLKEWGLV